MDLLSCLETFLSFSDKEKEVIRQNFKILEIKKKQSILKEGQVCSQYTFVQSGCFKMYAIDDKGFNHNIQFAAEGDWIADIGSFYTQTPSKLNIVALEPSVIWQIDQQPLYELFVQITKMSRILKVDIENKFVELQNRVLQNFSSTAETRYISFLEQYPNLSNRLANTEIASYLGITPEFLSKIRKDLCQKQIS